MRPSVPYGDLEGGQRVDLSKAPPCPVGLKIERISGGGGGLKANTSFGNRK